MAVVPVEPAQPAAPAVLPEPERPAAASRRAYLRDALPPIYRDRSTIGPPLLERWVGALEEVLDPIVLQLDNLAAHLDPAVTEIDWVDALTDWLGMRADRELSLDIQRARVSNAMELNRCRGTLVGLQNALDLTFPVVIPLARIHAEDGAQSTTGADPFERPAAPAPELVITVANPLDDQQRRVLLRLIGDQRPAHIPWRLVELATQPEPGPAAGPGRA
jgi:phage tail-like protein